MGAPAPGSRQPESPHDDVHPNLLQVRVVKKLSCQEVLDQLEDYLDDEARAELVEQVDQHLGACRHCQVEVDSIRRTIHIYRCNEQVLLPVTLSAKLQQALERAYQDGRPVEGEEGSA